MFSKFLEKQDFLTEIEKKYFLEVMDEVFEESKREELTIKHYSHDNEYDINYLIKDILNKKDTNFKIKIMHIYLLLADSEFSYNTEILDEKYEKYINDDNDALIYGKFFIDMLETVNKKVRLFQDILDTYLESDSIHIKNIISKLMSDINYNNNCGRENELKKLLTENIEYLFEIIARDKIIIDCYHDGKEYKKPLQNICLPGVLSPNSGDHIKHFRDFFLSLIFDKINNYDCFIHSSININFIKINNIFSRENNINTNLNIDSMLPEVINLSFRMKEEFDEAVKNYKD